MWTSFPRRKNASVMVHILSVVHFVIVSVEALAVLLYGYFLQCYYCVLVLFCCFIRQHCCYCHFRFCFVAAVLFFVSHVVTRKIFFRNFKFSRVPKRGWWIKVLHGPSSINNLQIVCAFRSWFLTELYFDEMGKAVLY